MSEGYGTQFRPSVPHPVADPVPQDGGYFGERGERWWTRTVKVDERDSDGLDYKLRYSQPARGRVESREGWGRG